MVVAVAAVRMVKMAGDAIIHMVAVRHRFVTAARAVRMARLMPAAAVVGGAALGVVARNLDHMLVDMSFVRVMKMPVMQIVCMPAVMHRGMSAPRPMLMRVIRMGCSRASRHGIVSFPCSKTAGAAVRLSAAWSIALRIKRSTCSSARA